jgi:hypothetical protein
MTIAKRLSLPTCLECLSIDEIQSCTLPGFPLADPLSLKHGVPVMILLVRLLSNHAHPPSHTHTHFHTHTHSLSLSLSLSASLSLSLSLSLYLYLSVSLSLSRSGGEKNAGVTSKLERRAAH